MSWVRIFDILGVNIGVGVNSKLDIIDVNIGMYWASSTIVLGVNIGRTGAERSDAPTARGLGVWTATQDDACVSRLVLLDAQTCRSAESLCFCLWLMPVLAGLKAGIIGHWHLWWL
jgi:hypothetical protein